MDILSSQPNLTMQDSPVQQLLPAPRVNKKLLKWGIIIAVTLALLSSIAGAYYLGLNNGR